MINIVAGKIEKAGIIVFGIHSNPTFPALYLNKPAVFRQAFDPFYLNPIAPSWIATVISLLTSLLQSESRIKRKNAKDVQNQSNNGLTKKMVSY
jgi:hypothetical protein